MNSNTNTTATDSNTTAATKAKKARTPRAKKPDPVTVEQLPPPPAEITLPEEAHKAPTTAQTIARAAAAFFVLVTLPPVEKFEAGKGYWQIEIKDEAGRRYSDIYRIKDLEKARDLAEKMARDRKLPIVTQEPPAPKKAQPEPVPMPDPEEEDGADQPEAGQDYSDGSEPTPF